VALVPTLALAVPLATPLAPLEPLVLKSLPQEIVSAGRRSQSEHRIQPEYSTSALHVISRAVASTVLLEQRILALAEAASASSGLRAGSAKRAASGATSESSDCSASGVNLLLRRFLMQKLRAIV
jgi:hypothetical protein